MANTDITSFSEMDVTNFLELFDTSLETPVVETEMKKENIEIHIEKMELQRKIAELENKLAHQKELCHQLQFVTNGGDPEPEDKPDKADKAVKPAKRTYKRKHDGEPPLNEYINKMMATGEVFEDMRNGVGIPEDGKIPKCLVRAYLYTRFKGGVSDAAPRDEAAAE